jgi:paraquat-inducible protein B
MSDPRDPAPSDAPLPQAVAVPRRRRQLYAVWLIPLIAALIGLTLAVRSVLDNGPTITIVFKTAEGLEAGKTKIKYKNVDIGDVRAVSLSRDGDGVVVTAAMAKAAQKLLVEDTRFWVERARFAGTGITGISTLLSGAYIGIDAGKAEDGRRNFVGLDAPPSVTTDEPGREFTLRASDVGSVDIGSPVYFRRVVVGKVTAAQLDADGRGVTLRVFVAAPHEKLVTDNTRFWHASGLDVSLDAGGIKLQTQSILSVLLGGIAFATPDTGEPAPAAKAGQSFRLFDNQATAMKRSDAEVTTLVAYFNETLRGLEPGAQVDFRGVVVGEVTAIDIEYDRERHEFRFPVSFVLYRDRLRSKVTAALERARVDPEALLQDSIVRGLRAQLRTGNLLSGQRYVALDFFKNAVPLKRDPKAATASGLIVMPTMPGSLEDLQASITNIAKRIESLPLDELVGELRRAMKGLETTLASTDRLIQRLDSQVDQIAPELRATIGEARQTMRSAGQLLSEDAPTPQALRESLRELGRASQSLRELTDYLQRRPESLLRGKPAEPAAGEKR